jgi:hypothetical protein
LCRPPCARARRHAPTIAAADPARSEGWAPNIALAFCVVTTIVALAHAVVHALFDLPAVRLTSTAIVLYPCVCASLSLPAPRGADVRAADAWMSYLPFHFEGGVRGVPAGRAQPASPAARRADKRVYPRLVQELCECFLRACRCPPRICGRAADAGADSGLVVFAFHEHMQAVLGGFHNMVKLNKEHPHDHLTPIRVRTSRPSWRAPPPRQTSCSQECCVPWEPGRPFVRNLSIGILQYAVLRIILACPCSRPPSLPAARPVTVRCGAGLTLLLDLPGETHYYCAGIVEAECAWPWWVALRGGGRGVAAVLEHPPRAGSCWR